jgi:peptidyl-prolyl cis-trans isomerase SurA
MRILPVSAVRGRLPLGLLLLSAVLACLALPVDATAQGRTLDQIAAVVGDEVVLASEVDQLVRRRTRQSRTSYTDDLWMETLQNLIDQRILAEKARRDTTLTLSEQQVSQQLDRRIDQMASRVGGRDQLEKRYGKSVLEIKETFRADFRGQLLAQRLRQRRMQKINITPSEVRQWFEDIPTDSLPQLPKTVRLSQIVRYPEPTEAAKTEARSLLSTIRDSVLSGEASFEAMARQFSDDPGTASSGGALGSVNLDQLVPEFAAVASRTPVGEISQVFYNDSQQGFHILRVNAKSGSQVDLSHILIKVSSEGTNVERVTSFLRSVRDSILNHDKPFAVMARRHSQENRSAENGGRVTDPQTGTRDLVLDALNPTWRQTIQDLETGEISKPTEVKLLNGDQAYHIVRLDRRVPAHRANLEQDYQRIRQLALRDKRQRKMKEWIGELREDVYVDVRITEEDLAALRSVR